MQRAAERTEDRPNYGTNEQTMERTNERKINQRWNERTNDGRIERTVDANRMNNGRVAVNRDYGYLMAPLS